MFKQLFSGAIDSLWQHPDLPNSCLEWKNHLTSSSFWHLSQSGFLISIYIYYQFGIIELVKPNISLQQTSAGWPAWSNTLHPPCPSLGFTANGTRAAHAEGSRDQCCRKSKAINQWPVITTADKISSFGHVTWVFFRDPESGNAHEQQGQVVSWRSCWATSKLERRGERLNMQQPHLRVFHHSCPEALGGERARNHLWAFSWTLARSPTTSTLFPA